MSGGPSPSTVARALWIAAPGAAEIRAEALSVPRPGEVLVETVASGVSRGTERLVFEGRVPESERGRMRAPFQAGDFPGPVKYGYAAVGRVLEGPAQLVGRHVFALHPHQDRFVVPEAAAIPVPPAVPPGRAVLAANMETALNIAWDAAIGPGDSVAIVGGGLVGLLAARLAARIPGTAVTVVDVDPARAGPAGRLGAAFALPGDVPADCDVVIHASASEEGLRTALAAAGFEARLVEASWYGDRAPAVPLGEAFHSRRLSLVASQVGAVPPARRARWTNRRRLEAAMGLLADEALEVLVTGETGFADLPGAYRGILADPGTLLHRIRY
ncbi:zinc-binding alcohol dehydrogenase [Propylenella binzhouense]|uniref:Zinc-binding alcohol dehydrogenase n=1 Tax=Propylenella binzhouense TaxID=2555902 RepID=A0A964T782_9HYPH|nr:zinc-binding alcohol dehydrogenase [Propylenella binzhouense]